MLRSMEEILGAMDRNGWACVPDYLTRDDSLRLMHECKSAFVRGDFRNAGVGQRGKPQVNQEIRGDQVLWIEPGDASAEQEIWLANLENLRLALNQKFYLGLFDYEGHFAIYQSGAFYKPHLDRHAASSERVVTVILYLNENWQPGDGGELKLWTTPGDKEGDFIIIEPRMGTMVCFLSGDFWHEVLPAHKTRASITGWFRQR